MTHDPSECEKEEDASGAAPDCVGADEEDHCEETDCESRIRIE